MKKILLGILLIGSLFAATSTQSLSFQGKLLDNSGVAVNGVRSMTFTLYPQSAGGASVPNAMWSQSVNVQNGIYAVELDASAVDLTMVSEAWMEVTVAGETLTPRIHLTSSAFAQKAATANYALRAGEVVGLTLNALLPAQTGNAGKVLKTDGTNASWTAQSTTVGSASGLMGAGWRRIAYIENTGYGCSGMFSISGTRGNVVYSHNISWSAGHPGRANATLLSAGKYAGFILRILVDNAGNSYLEVYLSSTESTSVFYRVEMYTGAGLTMAPFNEGNVPGSAAGFI
jgi:hypothetical protein